MQNFLNLKNKVIFVLNQCFSLVLGFLIVLSLLYIRLLPRVARNLWENLTYLQLLFIVVSILILCVYIISIVFVIVDKKPKIKPLLQGILNKFKIIYVYIMRLLCNLYDFLWYIAGIIAAVLFKRDRIHYHIMRKIASNFIAKDNYYIICILLIFIKYLPKIIFTLAFFFDVLLFKRLDWTFKCIPLLLFSLIESLYIFVIQDFCDTHKEGIYSFMEKKTINGETRYSFVDNKCPEFVSGFKDYFLNHYLVIKIALNNIEAFNNWKLTEFPSYYIDLFLAIIRLFLFIYLLFYGLSFAS